MNVHSNARKMHAVNPSEMFGIGIVEFSSRQT